jgi:DNA-binding helix-hairpin-helix protein with protein kinase domain
VLALQGDQGRVVKVYHSPCDQAKQQKLVAMVQMRSSALEAVSAWPIDLVWDQQGRCVGFVMPRVDGVGVVDRLSHPAERRKSFPEVDYLFIATVAKNLMAAASALHAAGVVIGDVNESNIVVRKDGTVSFVDADSFQVVRGGSTFYCEVGKDLFTPPELQGRSFRGVLRSPSHDVFGLAVLVFQLLMHGRHPFHGRSLDGRDRTTSESIQQGAYAYGRAGHQIAQPPLGTLPIAAFGELSGLFERAFGRSVRPTASDWMYALQRFCGGLSPCGRNRRHARLPGQSVCELCKLQRDPLPSLAVASHGPPVEIASVGDLIAAVSRISAPPSLAAICAEPEVSASERQLASAPALVTDSEYQRLLSGKGGAGPGAALLGVGGALLVGAIGLAFPLALCAAIPMLVSACGAFAAAIRTRRRSKQLMPAVISFEAKLGSAKDALAELVKAESQALRTETQLRPKAVGDLHTLQRAAQRIQQQSNELERLEREGPARYLREWRRDQLDNFIIADGKIAGIGTERSRVLASHGVETAADVQESAIMALSGFGPGLTRKLMEWRRECERVVDRMRAPPMPAQYLDRIRSEHALQLNDAIASVRAGLRNYQESARAIEEDLRSKSSAIANARRRFRAAKRAMT